LTVRLDRQRGPDLVLRARTHFIAADRISARDDYSPPPPTRDSSCSITAATATLPWRTSRRATSSSCTAKDSACVLAFAACHRLLRRWYSSCATLMMPWRCSSPVSSASRISATSIPKFVTSRSARAVSRTARSRGKARVITSRTRLPIMGLRATAAIVSGVPTPRGCEGGAVGETAVRREHRNPRATDSPRPWRYVRAPPTRPREGPTSSAGASPCFPLLRQDSATLKHQSGGVVQVVGSVHPLGEQETSYNLPVSLHVVQTQLDGFTYVVQRPWRLPVSCPVDTPGPQIEPLLRRQARAARGRGAS
jgi:hypothetical protein